ncbi:MAG: T9SS type A sorting domain-containing protein [Bacteroidota bacterium]|nr:T9SS type A sorting domain-containing protein [Bacteroidota bacterium]
MKKYFSLLVYTIACTAQLFSWGGTTHKFINKNAVTHLPVSMKQFIDSVSYLEKHAVDPDNRKNADPTEGPKHFLDIDYYPDYKHLTHNLDSLIAKYGYTVAVNDNGVLPWATVWALDSLTAQLKRGDWNKAYQTAADIGHYVADGHQPLHVTQNYDGQLTTNKGIHSRYESKMLDTNRLKEIIIAKDSVHYIVDPLNYVFDYLMVSNSYTDSILAADRYAAPPSGFNNVGSLPANYYPLLWDKTKDYTAKEIQSATIDLASLWYTAWVNAGLVAKPANVQKVKSKKPESFNLYQNFPNPFNPKTTIQFDVAQRSAVKLDIVSLEGKEITSLIDNELEEGSYSADWDARYVSSGVYLYRLETNSYSETRKLVLLK